MATRTAIGFFWGCDVLDVSEGGPLLYGRDATPQRRGKGLMDKWGKLPRKARPKHDIVTTNDGGVFLVGCWVAIDDENPGHGAASLCGETALVSEIQDWLEAQSARDAFEKFSIYAVAEGVRLGSPRMWLTNLDIEVPS